MNKVLPLLLLCLLALGIEARAQFTEGSLAATAGLSIASSKVKTHNNDGTSTLSDPTISLRLSPALGYFMASDLELGARLDLQRTSVGDENVKSITSQIGFAPYARKYITIGESVEFFGEGGFTVGKSKVKSKVNGESESATTGSHFSMGVSPGVVFMVSDKVGLEFKAGFFGYQSQKSYNAVTGDPVSTHSNFGLSLDMRHIDFGLRVYLN